MVTYRKVERKLPMRRVFCTLMIGLALGCRNQSLPLSNPFMAPDRVPPPATRTLLPGTAQPYYPGDPVPNSPAVGIPAPVGPPGTTSGPAQGYAPPPTTPTSPPGGWNTYQPSGPVSSVPSGNWYDNVQQANADISLSPATGETVQVPTDNEGLRFASATPPPYSPATPANYAVAPLAANQAEQFASFENPHAPNQIVQQPSAMAQREVSIREISSAELASFQGDLSSAPDRIGRDGFRPQGSSRTARDQAKATVRSALTASPTSASTASRPVPEPAERFGYEPQYRWLRGQLQYTPTTGQWYLRYISPEGTPDSLGGSVPITNPYVLGNLQPGEYVSVEGRLDMLQLDAQSVIPAYTISVLQRQQQDLR
jgi:hypothetical protein